MVVSECRIAQLEDKNITNRQLILMLLLYRGLPKPLLRVNIYVILLNDVLPLRIRDLPDIAAA
jgi:hypothetical protein